MNVLRVKRDIQGFENNAIWKVYENHDLSWIPVDTPGSIFTSMRGYLILVGSLRGLLFWGLFMEVSSSLRAAESVFTFVARNTFMFRPLGFDRCNMLDKILLYTLINTAVYKYLSIFLNYWFISCWHTEVKTKEVTWITMTLPGTVPKRWDNLKR